MRRGPTIRAAVAAATAGILVFAGMSLTAANVVPVTRAGSPATATDPNQLAPAACAGIVLTSTTVMAALSTTVTGPGDGFSLILGHTPVVGSTTTLNGKTGKNCIVGAGGAGQTIRLNGAGAAKGDVCVGRIAATNVFSGCQTTATIP